MSTATARTARTTTGSSSPLYQHVVRDARRGLRDTEIASITGVSDRAVQSWASGASKPDGAKRERLMEVKYVVEQHAYQRALDSQRPVDLLQQGRFADVLSAVERLAGGPRKNT